jgi:hypothetical protein
MGARGPRRSCRQMAAHRRRHVAACSHHCQAASVPTHICWPTPQRSSTPHIEAPWIQTTGWRWGRATTAPQCAGSMQQRRSL